MKSFLDVGKKVLTCVVLVVMVFIVSYVLSKMFLTEVDSGIIRALVHVL